MRLRYSITAPVLQPVLFITPFLVDHMLPFTAIYWLCEAYFFSTHQEYHRHSAEWEQQKVQYQKQLAMLENQKKSLADQFTKTKVMQKC